MLKITCDGYDEETGRDIDLKTETPTKVDGKTWGTAVKDLHQVMRQVPTAELQAVVAALNAGKVDGVIQNSWENDGCACFVGIVADCLRGTIPTGDEDDDDWPMDSFELFSIHYGETDCYTPFQQWLLLVRPGNTPANNTIAKLFHDELTQMVAERERK